MKTTLLLRIASGISLLFAAGHALGGTSDWSPVGETEVLNTMRTVRFDVMGVSRTYLDFYHGFGHTLTVFLVLQAIVLWQLAALAKNAPLQTRGMVASFALASLASGIISWKFILPIPAAFSAVLTVCLALAYFRAR
jgi:hypothetical protein